MYVNGDNGNGYGGLSEAWGQGSASGNYSFGGATGYGGLDEVWGFAGTKGGKGKNLGLHSDVPGYEKLVIGDKSMPAVDVPGATVADQARDVDYQDIYRNIQMQREGAAYNRDLVPEFSGLGNIGALMQNKTVMAVALVAAGLFAYKTFGKKKKR